MLLAVLESHSPGRIEAATGIINLVATLDLFWKAAADDVCTSFDCHVTEHIEGWTTLVSWFFSRNHVFLLVRANEHFR